MSTVKLIVNNNIHRFKYNIPKRVNEDIINLFNKVKEILEKEYKNEFITINQFYCKDLLKHIDKSSSDFIKIFMYKCSSCNNIILDYTVYSHNGYKWDEYESKRVCDNCEDFENELIKMAISISK